MDTYLLDWANLLVRWLHVVAAIAWIGESIYFVMLDNSLRPPADEEGRRRGVFGEMWSVHGGGFYHSQKYLTNPPKLPPDLHWSFWKSYTTWLSGFGLFALLYLANPAFYLVNPQSTWTWAANLTGWQAGALATVFLWAGWTVYNELCKRISPTMENDGQLSVAVALMMVGVAWLSAQIFQGRAAFVITGAVMATCMSANVFFWIIPGQRRMVADLKAGRTPNPLDGKRGKQRSVHNTYFTLPVVFLMISNHYAFTYGATQAWAVMVAFIVAGALIRQYFVLRHSGRNVISLPVAGVAALGAAAWLAMPAPKATPSADAAVSLAQVQAILGARCVTCHAQQPTQAGFSAAPAGIHLDLARDVELNASRIKAVVSAQVMPPGNMTGMTSEERDLIARWAGH